MVIIIQAFNKSRFYSETGKLQKAPACENGADLPVRERSGEEPLLTHSVLVIARLLLPGIPLEQFDDGFVNQFKGLVLLLNI